MRDDRSGKRLMEAGSNAMDFRVKTLERDSSIQHDSIGKLRGKTARHDTALAVQERQIEDHEHDLANLANRLGDVEESVRTEVKGLRDEMGAEFKGFRRLLYAATFTFTGLMLTAFGYILQAILSGNH